jgi:hypothetical protein
MTTHDQVPRVKVSPEMVKELQGKWSRPVQVMIEGRDADGDLKMVFRDVPKADA